MKIIRPSPAKIKLVGKSKPIKKWRESRKVRVPGYQFTSAHKLRGWDGYTRPGSAYFNPKTYVYKLTLGRGWLSDVKRNFPDAGVQQKYENSCELNKSQIELDGVWDVLRDYQKEAFLKVRNNRWGRIALATNAGKGAIIALLAKAALPSKTIVLTDEVAVFDALVEEIVKWAHVEPGLVESGREIPPEEDIVLGMIPTIRERIKIKDDASADELDRMELWTGWLNEFQVGLLDEADRATSDSWQMITDVLINTEYRAGFSGSFPEPGSLDDFNLMGTLGPTLIKVKNKELVERDISAKPIVQLVPYSAPWIPKYEWPEEKLQDPEFDTDEETPSGPALRRWAYRHSIIENEARHNLILSLLHPTKPNAIIVNRLDHGEELSEVIPDSIFLSGSDSKNYRRKILDDFRNGDFQNLIATRILDRGTNLLGNAVGLIFASGEGSSRQTLQRIGRGLRKGDNKEFLFLRDIMDRGHRYLDKASKKRLRVYQKEGFDIEFYDSPKEIEDES